MSVTLQSYLELLRSFVSHEVTADEFEARYLATFKGDMSFHDEPVYDVLNSLFGDVDAYCADESIRDSDDLGPDQLSTAAQRALGILEDLVSRGAK